MILWPVFLASALSLGVPSALTFQLRRNPGEAVPVDGRGHSAGDSGRRGGRAARACSSCLPGFRSTQPRVILFARIFLLSAPHHLPAGRGTSCPRESRRLCRVQQTSDLVSGHDPVVADCPARNSFHDALQRRPGLRAGGIVPLVWMRCGWRKCSNLRWRRSANPPGSCLPTESGPMASICAAPWRCMWTRPWWCACWSRT